MAAWLVEAINGQSDMSNPMDNAPMQSDAASDVTQVDIDCEAMRYAWDGFGYQYIDGGSGSDWRTRHPDAEPLYTRKLDPSALDVAIDSGMDGQSIVGAEAFWASLPTGRKWTSLKTYEKALICHQMDRLEALLVERLREASQ